VSVRLPLRVPGRIQHAHASDGRSETRVRGALPHSRNRALLLQPAFRLGLSERLLALVIPRRGEPCLSARLREGRLRRLQPLGPSRCAPARGEDPSKVAANWFAERGIRTGRVASRNERLPFTMPSAALRRRWNWPAATSITIGCRHARAGTNSEIGHDRGWVLACQTPQGA